MKRQPPGASLPDHGAGSDAPGRYNPWLSLTTYAVTLLLAFLLGAALMYSAGMDEGTQPEGVRDPVVRPAPDAPEATPPTPPQRHGQPQGVDGPPLTSGFEHAPPTPQEEP